MLQLQPSRDASSPLVKKKNGLANGSPSAARAPSLPLRHPPLLALSGQAAYQLHHTNENGVFQLEVSIVKSVENYDCFSLEKHGILTRHIPDFFRQRIFDITERKGRGQYLCPQFSPACYCCQILLNRSKSYHYFRLYLNKGFIFYLTHY